MDKDLPLLYSQYTAYFRDLQSDLDERVNLQGRFRPGVMSFPDFCKAWDRWAVHGVQQYWKTRFQRGYSNWVVEVMESLTYSLSHDDCEVVVQNRAA